MSDSNVIKMPQPMSVGGSKKGITWSVQFNPNNRTWLWSVIHNPNPNIFSGSAASQREAYDSINGVINNLT